MDYLQQLLNNQPVEWKKLGEVCTIKNGRDYKHLGEGKVPVYGSGGIMKYVDEYVYDKPTVLIPRKGSLSNLFYVDTPFWNVDTIFYTEIDTNQICPKFLFHFLATQKLEKLNMAGGVPSLTQTILNKLPIPLPPLSVQSRIVEILDKFTALEAELEAELELRKKQYAHYREQLLNFSSTPPHEFNVTYRKLGEVCTRTTGTKITAGKMKALHKENAPIKIFAGGKTIAFVDYGDIPEKDIYTTPSVIVKSRGIVEVEYYDKPFSHKSEMWSYASKTSELDTKFLYYYLKTLEFDLQRVASKMQMPQIAISDTESLPIPLPPLSVQSRIVEILDKFDTLTNSITEGLPQEIKLRKQQYEYYREQLLNFPHH